MRRFRSYFSKNNTIVKNSHLNSSQNPVTEIVYGGGVVSRFLCKIDLKPLIQRINQGYINPENIIAHKLVLVNSIRNIGDRYIGKKSYSQNIERATGFTLECFNIENEWNEGTGYDLVFDPNTISTKEKNESPSNWFNRTTHELWDVPGAFNEDTSEIIGTQNFDKGNENLIIDLTEFINEILNNHKQSEGVGFKYIKLLEDKFTKKIQSVGFHTKHTHTFFQPYLETYIDDVVKDSRNFFYQNQNNRLYFYKKVEGNIEFETVTIYDNNGNVFKTINPDEIQRVNNNTYFINLKIGNSYPDSVIFNDEWEYTINGEKSTHKDYFYIISENSNLSGKNEDFKLDNYSFYFWGIRNNETIERGGIRKIKITVKELYATQENRRPLNLYYRLYTKINTQNEIDIIPITPVNHTKTCYEFYIDTSYLLPQDYRLDVCLYMNSFGENKETINFRVV